MFGRVFFIVAGIVSFCTILFFGYQLIHNQHTLSPTSIFNSKDSNVLIINHVNEVDVAALDFSYPKNETKIIAQLLATPCFSERIYISSSRNRLLIELKTNWSDPLVQRYFKLKKIVCSSNQSTLQLEGGFTANYVGNYLMIGKQKIETENWNQLQWPTWDKMASCAVIDFQKSNTSNDYYFHPTTLTSYQSISNKTTKMEKVNDFELFASVLPKGINNYHFLAKNYAVSIGQLKKQDLMYQWCDQGFVRFEINGILVIVSDFKSTIDPFELLNEETEEEEVVAGSKSTYEGIQLLANFPKQSNGTFCIKYLEDKVVISESQEAVNQVLAYYETGRTLALSPMAKKSIYENLPSSVCERYIKEDAKFTSTVAQNKLITVRKLDGVTAPLKSDKKEGKEDTETYTIEMNEDVISIIGSHEIQICFTNTKLIGIHQGKKVWEKKYEGTLVGRPIVQDLMNDGNQQILFTTTNKIYLLDKTGDSFKGFPISIAQKPSSEAVFYEGKKGKQLVYVSSNNEMIKYNARGKRLKSLKTGVNSSTSSPFIFKNGKKLFAVVLGKNGGQVIQLDPFSKANTFPTLDEKTVFCATGSTPAFFYPEKGKLIRNDFTGKTSRVGNYSSIDILRTIKGSTREYVTFLSNKNFHICDGDGKVIRTVELPSANISDYQVLTLEDGTSVVAFLDTIENSIFLYTTKGKKLTQQALEGQQVVCLSEITEGIIITTQGKNLIIQYKIEK